MKFIILFCVLAALAASSVEALSSPLELLLTQQEKEDAGFGDIPLGSQYDDMRNKATMEALKGRLSGPARERLNQLLSLPSELLAPFIARGALGGNTN